MAWLIERNDTAVPVYLAGSSPAGALYGTFTADEALKFDSNELAQLVIEHFQLLDNWEARPSSTHIPLPAAETDLR